MTRIQAVAGSEEAVLLARQARRNRVWLVVLAVLAIVMMLLSYPLFNNYWDPALSDQTISH
jgi:t-SNARE complex subunit (syntaxin)